MKKPYLLTPGPTVLPESVVTSFAQPILHHRSPEFEKLFAEVREQIKYVFQTEKDVLILTSTGSGAMEAAITNLFSVGEKVITINAGKFGERWTKMSKAFGLQPVEILIERGQTLDVAQLEKTLSENTDAKAVLFQAHETSTGVVLPTEEIAKLCLKHNVLSICDAITAVGAFDLPMDKWQLDVVISGSQKAMMIPPGLAFIALSDKAWKASELATIPHFYFDLSKERKGSSKKPNGMDSRGFIDSRIARSLAFDTRRGTRKSF
jgi:aspartate aminotransferase-like enzyme